MAKAMKMIHQVWQWLARHGAERALDDRRVADYVERRRRDIVRRAADQIGTY